MTRENYENHIKTGLLIILLHANFTGTGHHIG